MPSLMSRSTRRKLRDLNSGAQDVKGFIEQNPVTSAVLALAAGVATTSAVKMTMNRLAKPAAKAAPKAKPKAKSKAKSKASPKAARKKTRRKGIAKPK